MQHIYKRDEYLFLNSINVIQFDHIITALGFS